MNRLNIRHSSHGSIKLVAIHGLGSAHTAWKLLSQQFPEEIDFITLDLPGHGISPHKASEDMTPARLAEIVRLELLDHGITEFHLTGNSLGGWVALELGAAFPENVLSITAIAPAGLWLNPQTKRSWRLDSTRLLAQASYRFAAPLLKVKPLRALGFKMVSPQWEEFSIETCADATIAMGSSSGYPHLWNGMLGHRFDKPISTQIPVTVIFGDSDNTLPAQYCQERSLVPEHSEWIVLPRSGHAPMWDQTDRVAEIISRNLSSVN
jgi:pimeloyl-ACP methyl ester carboxylesterase